MNVKDNLENSSMPVITRSQAKKLGMVIDDISDTLSTEDEFETHYNENDTESGSESGNESDDDMMDIGSDTDADDYKNDLDPDVREQLINAISGIRGPVMIQLDKRKYKNHPGSNSNSDSGSKSDEIKNKPKKKPQQQKCPYKTFKKMIDSIHQGSFFDRIPLEDKSIGELKSKMSVQEVQEKTKELQTLKKLYHNNSPSVVNILESTKDKDKQKELLERLHMYSNSEMLSPEYALNLKFLEQNTKPSNLKIIELEKRVKAQSCLLENQSYKEQILRSKMSFDNKVVAYNKAEIMESYSGSDASEYSKYKSWLDTLLSVPFGIYNKSIMNESTSVSLKNVKDTLDKKLSFMYKPKDQIINVVSRMLRNPESSLNSIGLYGSKGTGKSSIVASIAEALNRPFKMISLGGESDSSALCGHGFTYVGSMPGRLIEILRESKMMNPVVLIDEIDKISQTTQGKEIIGTLIHLTDTTTNNKYNQDKYFSGIEFDLSQILFVFTYNDPDAIDKILADRMYKIKVDNYTQKEKFEIAKTHIIKTVLEGLLFTESDILFSDECIQYIIQKSQGDEGMRNVKTKFEVICSRVNTLLLTNPEDEVVSLAYKELYPYYKSLPVNVQINHVDTFLKDSPAGDQEVDKNMLRMYS